LRGEGEVSGVFSFLTHPIFGTPTTSPSHCFAMGPALSPTAWRRGSMSKIFIAFLILASPAAAADIGIVSAGTARTLQVGSELQPGQRIVTGPDDRLDLLFVDGTSVTLAANSTLVIDRFDHAASSALALNAELGTFRVVGGAGEHTVHLVTPAATVDLKNGIATVDVADRGVVATLLQGDTMTVAGQGVSKTVTRTGSQISTVGGLPGPPRVMWRGGWGPERFEQTATDPSQRLFGLSGTILRPRVSDVRTMADESPSALTSNPDNSSSTPEGTVFKPPMTVSQSRVSAAKAAVAHHTSTSTSSKTKPKTK
jgi:hypothetical protein